mgnify:CR=1 FL=1
MGRYSDYLKQTYMPIRIQKHLLPSVDGLDLIETIRRIDFTEYDKVTEANLKDFGNGSCSGYINRSTYSVKAIDNVLLKTLQEVINDKEYNMFLKRMAVVWAATAAKTEFLDMLEIKGKLYLVGPDGKGLRLELPRGNTKSSLGRLPSKLKMPSELYHICAATLPGKIRLHFDGHDDIREEMKILFGSKIEEYTGTIKEVPKDEVKQSDSTESGSVPKEEGSPNDSVCANAEKAEGVPPVKRVRASKKCNSGDGV